jgi:hypothetical protein
MDPCCTHSLEAKLFTVKLDEYQEQSYLLDPFLENLVVPVANRLKAHANVTVSAPNAPTSATRVGRLAQLLYSYIKCRGYKTISSSFQRLRTPMI